MTSGQLAIRSRLDDVEARVQTACASCGRDRSEVELIAVTKTVPLHQISHAYDLGQRQFGESRLQEATPKIESLPSDISWHFIGALQSNKAKRIGSRFSVVHTLDRDSQLVELAKLASPVDVLVEVNIANEPQKSGVKPETLDAFLDKVLDCNQVRLRGLMTIGPDNPDQENSRQWFRKLRKLLSKVPDGTWLSMGMSTDFEVAIQEGATHIRIGSALFGSRPMR